MMNRRATKHRAVPAKKGRTPINLPEAFSALDAAEVLRLQLRRDLEALENGKGHDGKPLSQQQYRMLKSATVAAVRSLGELTGESLQMPESKIVRLPAFRRLVDAIKRALEPYPDAMTAVAAALERAAGGQTT